AQVVSSDIAMLICELMMKCERLVIMKYHNGGKGRSILIGEMNVPVCDLHSEFRCSKECRNRPSTTRSGPP
ncbi:hypothetical protein HAX54_024211, partial [Datura stramonium]|nr:hypothetical protein [Datura stramonium]